VLQDVSFSIANGECLALVGETGSGKTMTTRVITGLVGRSGGRVVNGAVVFDGLSLVDAPAATWKQVRGRRIALVPQSSLASLNPVIKVGNQLRETIKTLNPHLETRRRSIELLDMVRLPKAADVMRLYPHELSGGMRQRVMIALALAGDPELLIADEATTALDTTIQRGILDLISELRTTSGLAVLFVTHDLGLVRRFTDSVAVMYAGAVVESGSTAAVLEHASHPYTKALLASIPSVERRGAPLLPVPGLCPAPHERGAGCAFAPRCNQAEARCHDQRPVLEVERGDHSVSCWLAVTK
jgi:oligopeptide/dipeptide ABC transporter ATP-binding protein